MARVRVESFTISLDGYGAGPAQDIDNPLGVGGTDLHQWFVPTRTFQRIGGAAMGRLVSMTTSRCADSITSVPGFLEGTCSDRFAALGPTWAGRGGGVTTHPITSPFLS